MCRAALFAWRSEDPQTADAAIGIDAESHPGSGRRRQFLLKDMALVRFELHARKDLLTLLRLDRAALRIIALEMGSVHLDALDLAVCGELDHAPIVAGTATPARL